MRTSERINPSAHSATARALAEEGADVAISYAVSADKAEALRLFRLAVEQGEEKAAREVERLAKEGTP